MGCGDAPARLRIEAEERSRLAKLTVPTQEFSNLTPGGGADVSRNPRYIVILAIASGLILIIGWFLKPAENASEAVLGTSQVELSRLPALIERRSLEDMAEFFGELAADLAPAVVQLRSIGRTGVVWSTDRVVTARVEWQFPAAVTVATGAGDVGAYTNVAGPHLPLAAIQTPRLPGRVPPQTRPGRPLRRGEWVLAVWYADDEVAFSAGSYLETAPRTCGELPVEELVTSLPMRATMLGGGVFDLDRNIVGALLQCDDDVVTVTTRGVDEILGTGQSLDARLGARWGIRVEPLTSAEAFHFGQGNGFIVRELWDRYRGQAAGMRPGDILVALDGVEIQTVEELRILDGAAAPDQESFSLVVRRGGLMTTVTLPGRLLDRQLDQAAPASAGMVWEESVPGYRIASVLPGTRAAAAGIEAGDRLMRVDHEEPVSLEAVEAVLADDHGVSAFVELARGGRSWGVLLP